MSDTYDNPYHTVYGDSRIKWVDQNGTSISLKSAEQYLEEQTAEERSMDASSLRTTALYLLGTTLRHLEGLAASEGNAQEVSSLMKNVDPLLRTKIASHSMQNRMQLLTLMGEILEMPLCMSQDGNAICVGNSLWPQESDE